MPDLDLLDLLVLLVLLTLLVLEEAELAESEPESELEPEPDDDGEGDDVCMMMTIILEWSILIFIVSLPTDSKSGNPDNNNGPNQVEITSHTCSFSLSSPAQAVPVHSVQQRQCTQRARRC